jgi:orotidine-5'-phosphate decarboxylase
MTTQDLVQQIKKKKSMLCVGLDVDLSKIPQHLLDHEDPIFEFNKAIIDATHNYCIAYKPNIAFYEAYGLSGWKALKKTIEYINECYPEQFTIADAKRGDIGNTSRMYAKAFFEDLNFDSVTVAPYMGKDSVEPFLTFKDKHTILLGLTSNQGSEDFQFLESNDLKLYESVLTTSLEWTNSQQLMYVIGATKASHLKKIRTIIPHHFLLIPGVGAQGGSLEEVCKYGLTENYGLIINSSRGIIYASQDIDFAEKAATVAKELQQQMQVYIK